MDRLKYGDREDGTRGTIHGTQWLDIEMDENDNVVAVWFRCLTLPFKVFHRTIEGGYVPRRDAKHPAILCIDVDRDNAINGEEASREYDEKLKAHYAELRKIMENQDGESIQEDRPRETDINPYDEEM